MKSKLVRNAELLRRRSFVSWGGIVFMGLFSAALVLLNDYVMNLPLFFDTIGTLVVTAAFGIIPGAAAAVLTHLTVAAFNDAPMIMLMFTPVNIASAVVLGVMINRGRCMTPVDAVVAIVLITVVNSLLGAVIAAFLYTGETGHQVDYLVSSFMAIGQNLVSSSFWARLPVNVIDKGLAVLIAYVLKRSYFDRWADRKKEEYSREK